MSDKAEVRESPMRCGICGATRILVGYTALNRPLLHCTTCDRRPKPKRRPHPSHR